VSKTLHVSEKFSKYWPVFAWGGLIASLFFLGAYFVVTDPLVGSYLRLAAFACFVIGFLSLFKLKDGQLQINFKFDDEPGRNLEIKYFIRGRLVHSETIEMADVTGLKADQMPNRSIYNDINNIDRCVRLQKKNMDGWIYLTELHGRVIPLSKINAKKIVAFITEHLD